MIKINIRNRIFNIGEKDIVLFNGACYQLITQRYHSEKFSFMYPVLSKQKSNKWVKSGTLVLYKEESGLKYYKFDLNKLEVFKNGN